MAKKGLGKGLNVLLPGDDLYTSPEEQKNIAELKTSEIEPNKNQPRKDFDQDKIDALAKSISEHGMIQPIVVTPLPNGRYCIVAGERRWRAAKRAGISKVPVLIRDYTKEQVAQIALIENLQREDLNPIEEALGYQSLLEDYSLTQELISQKIGKSRSAIANSLRLLTLEDSIRKLLIAGEITGGHARAILSLQDTDRRLALAKKIVEDGLNVRQAEAIAKQLQTAPKEKQQKQKSPYEIELEALQAQLSASMGTKVKISHGTKKGKIEIEYYGNQDLERILAFFK